MEIGKAAIFFFAVTAITLVAMSVASVLASEQTHDSSVYTNDTAINKTSGAAIALVKSAPGIYMPGIVIGGILLFGSAIIILGRRSK